MGVHKVMTGVQLTLRLLLELASLVALAIGGYGLWNGGPVGVRAPIALVLPVAAAVLWGRYAAPRRPVRDSAAAWYGVQLLVWGSSVALLAVTGHSGWAIGIGVVMIVNTVWLRLVGEWSPEIER
ncbi:YrdB family protein [Kitasatospora sp. NPDC092948]|uniref:YrdB family protein n=1 Tax=Kitasatospora sp. NPDC092948 TaxID=3364088 RepID=UPI00380B10CF